jgi:hypothetical protein
MLIARSAGDWKGGDSLVGEREAESLAGAVQSVGNIRRAIFRNSLFFVRNKGAAGEHLQAAQRCLILKS